MVKTSDILLLLFIIVVTTLMYLPGAGEWYSVNVYPCTSWLLSLMSSILPWSLEEWVVIIASLSILVILANGIARKEKLKMMLRVVRLLAWMWVWFYLGWGATYFRAGLADRIGAESGGIEVSQFSSFLDAYTRGLRSACCDEADTIPASKVEAAVMPVDRDTVVEEVKQLFGQLPPKYGLCRPHAFQQPKRVVVNPLYSAIGVLGYMGPFFCESQLNEDLSDLEYPSVYAHELSHLLGVSSEAEASYWAFVICRRSRLKAVRYSGYLQLLPYVARSAHSVLDEAAYRQWRDSLPAAVLAHAAERQAFWHEKRSQTLDHCQDLMLDWYLRHNRIEAGIADYGQVIRLLLTVPAE